MIEGIAGSIWTALTGAAWAAIIGMPWWGWVIVGAIPFLLNLWFLAQVKNLFGWKAVGAVLLVEWTAFIYVLAYIRGRGDMAFNPFDKEDVAKPKTERDTVLPRWQDMWGKQKGKRKFNADTGMWEPI